MILAILMLTTGVSAPAAQPTPPIATVRQLQRVSDPAGEFDRRAWEERLEARDLDARERAFAELVEEAVANEGARDALRAWALDAQRTELAWTARLALREVERRPGTHLRALKQFGGGAMGDLRQRFQELEQGFGGLDSLFGDLQRDLDRLFQLPPSRVTPPQAGTGAPQGGLRAQSESFRLRVAPDGVEVEIDSDVDGQKTTETYTGRSLEEVLEANPKLRERLGRGGGNSFFFGLGAPGLAPRAPRAPDPWPSWPRSFDTDDRWGSPARPLAPVTPPTPAKTRTDILGVLYTQPGPELRAKRGLEEGLGLLVESTQPGTIAAALGVQAGDVLVGLNGRALKDREDVVRALRDRPSGEPVKLEVVDAKGRRHVLTWNES